MSTFDKRNRDFCKALTDMQFAYVEAEAENAKLRELVETFGMIANDAVCDYYERDEMLEQANADARELGIEVNDDGCDLV